MLIICKYILYLLKCGWYLIHANIQENTTCTNQQQQQLQQRQHQHQPKSEVSALTSQETITAKENDTGQEEPLVPVL